MGTWGGKRPGAGRKPDADAAKKTRTFKATDLEYQQIKDAAAEAGLCTSEYIRKMATEPDSIRNKIQIIGHRQTNTATYYQRGKGGHANEGQDSQERG